MCYNHHASFTVTFLLWFFLGIFGAHRFYLGLPLSGLLYFFTGGLFTIGWFVDLFFLNEMVCEYNEHCNEHTFIVQPVNYESQYP